MSDQARCDYKITAVTLAYLNATVLKGEAQRIVAVNISQHSPELIEIVYEPKPISGRLSKQGGCGE